jgi:NAD(P)-dependent dehydrogenase (short-subunit alcohol dehydrogenase family)
MTDDREQPVDDVPGAVRRQMSRRDMLRASGVVTTGLVGAGALWSLPSAAAADPSGTLAVSPLFYPVDNFVPQVDLHGKVAVITGASRGNGRAAAEALQAQGATVYGTSRDPRHVPNAPNYDLLELDIADGKSIDKFDKELGKVLSNKKVDILINNAGRTPIGNISPPHGTEQMFLEQSDLAVRTIFKGHVDVTTALLPRLPTTGYARVMFTVSAAAFVLGDAPGNGGFVQWFGFYVSGKRALYNYANGLRAALASTNVKVSTVNPLFVKTGLADHPHPIYLQPVDSNGNDPTGANTAYSQNIQLFRYLIANGFPASLVGNTYAQLARATNPAANVIVGSATGTIAAQGLTDSFLQGALEDNTYSAAPFVVV